MTQHTSRATQHVLDRRTFLQLLGGTTVAAALAACRPIVLPPAPAEAGAAAQTAEELALQKVVVNGAELHYVEQGQGTPLVLVHGGLSDYREWGPQMTRFAQDHR